MSTIFDAPGTSPPNPFTPIIQDDYISQSPNSPSPQLESTANAIIEKVTTSPDPGNALFHLWDAFFTSVVHTPPAHHTHLLSLLSAMRAHPPTKPTHPALPGSDREKSLLTSGHLQRDDGHFHWSKLPLFPAQWRDTHDILESRREWDGAGVPGLKLTATPGEYFVRFVKFSAVLVREYRYRYSETNPEAGEEAGGGPVHPINVFYAARNVLESAASTGSAVWQLDVKVTAIWLLYGARALWKEDGEHLREHYARTLDWKTDLWAVEEEGKRGLTRERWALWAERLRALGGQGGLDEETKGLVEEAIKVVEGLLAEGGTD